MAGGFAVAPRPSSRPSQQHLTAIALTLCPWHPLSVLIRAAGAADLRYVPGPATWSEARTVCQGLGGDLATIFSEQENLAAFSMLPSSASHAWIGGRATGIDNTFEWVDGSPLSDQCYSNWAINEPSGDGACINIWGESVGVDTQPLGTWNDNPCTTALDGSICRVPTTGESERVRIRPPSITFFETRIRAGDLCALMYSPCTDAGSGGHAR